MNTESEIFSYLTSIGLPLLGILAIYMAITGRKKSTTSPKQDIDYEALERAEKEVAGISKEESQRIFLENYRVLDQFPSTASFSEDYIVRLTLKLKERGLDADYRWSEMLPAGTDMLLRPTGTYEIFVAREQYEMAVAIYRDVLAQFRASPH